MNQNLTAQCGAGKNSEIIARYKKFNTNLLDESLGNNESFNTSQVQGGKAEGVKKVNTSEEEDDVGDVFEIET